MQVAVSVGKGNMRRRQVLTTILLVGICALAVAVAMLAVIMHGDVGAALVAAVALLALAQMVAFISRASDKRGARDEVSDLMAASDAFARDLLVLRHRVDSLESRTAGNLDKVPDQVDQQVSNLRHSATRMKQAAPASSKAEIPQPGRCGGDRKTEPALLDGPATERPKLYLEPIVRLVSNKTAYYRASLDRSASFRVGSAWTMPVDGGLSLFEQVAPIVRRLQDRNRAVGVFCPLSADALADERFIGRLIKFVEMNGDIAGALVIDISQQQLAQLDENGQKGLAHLAQLGATFCLSQCRLNVPDLAALRHLGFDFVDADVELLIDAKRHAPCPAAEMVSEARRLDISIIAANVTKESEVAWIQDSFELARGARFSPARPVRHDITVQASLGAVA